MQIFYLYPQSTPEIDAFYESSSYLLLPINGIAILCLVVFLYKFYTGNEPFNCYTSITVYRSYYHIFSSTLSLTIIGTRGKCFNDPIAEIFIYFFKELCNMYFIKSEFLIAINRYLAVYHFTLYDRVFSRRNCHVIQLVIALLLTVLILVIFGFIADPNDPEKSSLVSFCLTTSEISLSFLINMVTLRKLIKGRSGLKSSKSGNVVRTFCFASFQLFLSFCVYFTIVFRLKPEYDFASVVYFTSGETTKDFLEGCATLYFYREAVFKRSKRNLVVSTTMVKNNPQV